MSKKRAAPKQERLLPLKLRKGVANHAALPVTGNDQRIPCGGFRVVHNGVGCFFFDIGLRAFALRFNDFFFRRKRCCKR